MSTKKAVVITGASLKCGSGDMTGVFIATNSMTLVQGKPIGGCFDAEPVKNITPFGMCRSLANPAVAAATLANAGVLTPMPCLPSTKAWLPETGSIFCGGAPILTAGCVCLCTNGGVISIDDPGQKTFTV